MAMGLSRHEIDLLHAGAMLHDVGKIAVPEAILHKPGRFPPSEYQVMKGHPAVGAHVCQKLKSTPQVLDIVRFHHERLNGTGYPLGLSGSSIPLLARIVTIVDIYDALRSRRCYKEAFSIPESLGILHREADQGWWDGEILSLWEKCVLTAAAV